MENHITENIMDFVKYSAMAAPPVASGLFGISLQDWMYIVSIVASFFLILDRIPAVVERIRGKFKKQSSDCSDSRPPDQPSS